MRPCSYLPLPSQDTNADYKATFRKISSLPWPALSCNAASCPPLISPSQQHGIKSGTYWSNQIQIRIRKKYSFFSLSSWSNTLSWQHQRNKRWSNQIQIRIRKNTHFSLSHHVNTLSWQHQRNNRVFFKEKQELKLGLKHVWRQIILVWWITM